MKRNGLKREKVKKRDVVLYAICAVLWGLMSASNYANGDTVSGTIYVGVALVWIVVAIVEYRKYKVEK